MRSDGGKSVWLEQDELGGLQHPEAGMYTLTYGEAVELGYCRPVAFHRHGGLFTVDLGNALEAQVSRLRKRLSDCQAGVMIDGIRGVGYMLRVLS